MKAISYSKSCCCLCEISWSYQYRLSTTKCPKFHHDFPQSTLTNLILLMLTGIIRHTCLQSPAHQSLAAAESLGNWIFVPLPYQLMTKGSICTQKHLTKLIWNRLLKQHESSMFYTKIQRALVIIMQIFALMSWPGSVSNIGDTWM